MSNPPNQSETEPLTPIQVFDELVSNYYAFWYYAFWSPDPEFKHEKEKELLAKIDAYRPIYYAYCRLIGVKP